MREGQTFKPISLTRIHLFSGGYTSISVVALHVTHITCLLVVCCSVSVRCCRSKSCGIGTVVMVVLQPYIGDMIF